ncbi:MAG: putative toxin-antitoxin system toxin component, PIN family [Candidatus Bathyarchaeota archaeon]|nr:putative toxin-antitoxin system toxin component, PIN family [Candidatus Bathyarchaeota archaeon]
MFRVVFDTNVLISAILTDGKARALLRKGISKEFRIVTSNLILRELGNVLRRPKFKTGEDEIHKIILALMQAAEVVEVVSKFTLVEEDPTDDMVVETAFDGKADFVVSGDSHLLGLKIFRGIKIVSVNQMLVYLEEKSMTRN